MVPALLIAAWVGTHTHAHRHTRIRTDMHTHTDTHAHTLSLSQQLLVRFCRTRHAMSTVTT